MKFNFSNEPGKVLFDRDINKGEIPLISIITPYYNAGKYFEQTFNCVLNQTFPWFEWIIVDDGSTDKEDIARLKVLAKTDVRIKIITQQNRGQASARNNAASNSTTEIIVPLDADDLITPTYLECIYWGLKLNPGYSWCYTDSVGFGEQEYVWKKEFSSDVMKKDNILTCTAAIRKQDFIEVGGYDEVSKHYDEDWKLWLDLLAKGKKPVHLDQIAFWYRRTSNGMGSQVRKNSDILNQSQNIIKKAAQNIANTVEAKEYPLNQINKFNIPENTEWNKKISSKHDKVNIMMLLPWMEMGGADLFNLDVVRKLDKSKYQLSILTTVPAENTWRSLFEESTQDIFELPTFLEVDQYAIFISYFIKSRQIDIVFLTNSYYGYYLIPWIRKEFPHVAIVDYVHMEEWYWRNGGYARTAGALGEITERTYVCNNRTRNILINNFKREKDTIKTIYIGVDKDKYNSNNTPKSNAKEKLGIKEQRPTVLFPCRIHPQKRPFLMLEIAKETKKLMPEIAFVVVGDGPQLNELQIKVKDVSLENTIYFAGRQADMRKYYNESDLTLICSLKEGLALTAYESLSMGTPVISSDVGGQAELIDNEVGAILPLLQIEGEALDAREFSNEEIMQYVNVICDILRDKEKYQRLCDNCRSRIEESFSTDIMIENLEKEFKELMSLTCLEKRRKASENLKQYECLINDYLTLYTEYELLENSFKNAYTANTKNELMRLANSKWGSRIIRLAFKLKLNKLFK
ncbi:glycosyltransferase [Clostridium sp. CMCC3677]|uniref:glycosyltransferase n=1 Tax=Clostridium sp. CMCC3677 TaxID=2949963 RepID=UPI0013F02DCD|nr:glycosyltransferase [Clostridium sp. CMCC3677]NFG60721.1 glycosyltransferase [Clostridium botulinum]NFQ08155.1 glycosyltransferase [Clostridium botulinum]